MFTAWGYCVKIKGDNPCEVPINTSYWLVVLLPQTPEQPHACCPPPTPPQLSRCLALAHLVHVLGPAQQHLQLGPWDCSHLGRGWGWGVGCRIPGPREPVAWKKPSFAIRWPWKPLLVPMLVTGVCLSFLSPVFSRLKGLRFPASG